MGMFSQVTKAVNSFLPKLFDDPDLPVTVTYQRFNASEFDEAQGYNVDTYDEYSIKAIRVDNRSQAMSGRTRDYLPGAWQMQMGALGYIFRTEDFPEGASLKDMITDGVHSYSVANVEPIHGLITRVTVEGDAQN